MCTASQLVQPSTFMSGAEYLWRKKRGGRLQTLVPVRFVDYDT